MAPSSSTDIDSPSKSSSPSTFIDNPENNLQPFFVLHKKSSSSRPKTRRKIDVLSNTNSPNKGVRKLEGRKANEFDEEDYLNSLRIEAFHYVWSNIETTIKGVLRDINLCIFNDVNTWVHESFKAIRTRGEPGFSEATRPYPMVIDATSKQIFTGLVHTKNMEFVDDQLTFEELGDHLKSQGSHVANMSSMDFSAKHGIGGCLTRLLRQLLMVTLDVADISVLASWYSEQRECKPLVIIIEDTERCCGSILSDFILILSEWVVKIPVILVLGIATTIDAPRNLLSSNALLQISTSKFILRSTSERMNAIVEAILLRSSSWFSVGHKVALLMRDYFMKHDGTMVSFIRALKIACMQHFCAEPLSFLLKHLAAGDDLQQMWLGDHAFMQDVVLKHCSQLLSCRRVGEPSTEKLAHALIELIRLQRHWSSVVMCLYDAGKPVKIQLLDLYNEALNPDPHQFKSLQERGSFSGAHFSDQRGGSPKRASIYQAVQKVRDFPPAALSELVKSWERRADNISEIFNKVKELQCMMKPATNKTLASDLPDASSKHTTRVGLAKDQDLSSKKAVALIEWMIRDHMKPIEGLPFHEILCFKNVDKLQSAIIGDPRKKIQADLVEFHKFLCCSCCSNRGNRLLPSLHDTSILYTLAQEHGDLINVHDWYQSFKSIVVNPSSKARSKSKRASTPKKRKDTDDSQNDSGSAIQARFCKAVSELQITGLLRMPSKRRPDFVQRVAFDL